MNIKTIIPVIAALLMSASCGSFLDTVNEKSVHAHQELTTYDALCATTANLYT